uniref:Histone H2A n=1 Tax=Crypthecodinium cohnii TaxID=2866 RepID=A0A6N0X9R0_CRYCO|nr:histone H2A.X1 [Crypthecodinium cohnii]
MASQMELEHEQDFDHREEDVEIAEDGASHDEEGSEEVGDDVAGGAAKLGSKHDKAAKAASIQKRSRLSLPIHRFTKNLKRGGYAKRVALTGSVMLTSVVEYVTAEILELAGNAVKDQKKNRILPRHIQLAVRSDEELNKYMSKVTIAGGGVIPNVHSSFLPSRSASERATASAPSASLAAEPGVPLTSASGLPSKAAAGMGSAVGTNNTLSQEF